MSHIVTSSTPRERRIAQRKRNCWIPQHLEQLPVDVLRTICAKLALTQYFRFEGEKLIVNIEEVRWWPEQKKKTKRAVQWALALKVVETIELVTLTVSESIDNRIGRYPVVHAVSIEELRPWFRLIGGTGIKLKISEYWKKAYKLRVPPTSLGLLVPQQEENDQTVWGGRIIVA